MLVTVRCINSCYHCYGTDLPFAVGCFPILENDAGSHFLPHAVPRNLVESLAVALTLKINGSIHTLDQFQGQLLSSSDMKEQELPNFSSSSFHTRKVMFLPNVFKSLFDAALAAMHVVAWFAPQS